MKRVKFIQSLLTLLALPHFLKGQNIDSMKQESYVRLIRHATLLIQFGNKKILVDPMLSAKNEMDPVVNAGNDIRIPMVDLPFNNQELTKILKDVDAVFITHTHRDHWDLAAQKLIDKGMEIFCQPSDEVKIKEQGFKNVRPISTQVIWNGLQIFRTNGQHGTGEIGKKMGDVSGFIFKNKDHAIYVAGDTIWCRDVEDSLQRFKPDITILNTGGAQFLTGDPITMTYDDVIHVHESLPKTKIIAVHMNTVNHCLIKREDLQKAVTSNGIAKAVSIPIDGESIHI
jgi:L-ascorbate metabolism protein UlaG (beta-lactamase superfamily)